MDKTDYICVNCGVEQSKLYTKYEKDVIKLAVCNKCGQIVDKYVEFDFILIFIDLLLQYLAAYRHLFINVNVKSYWRVIIVFIIFSAYNKWTHDRSSLQVDLKFIYELEWQFYKSLFESAVEIFAYAIVVCLLSVAFDRNIHNFKQFISISICGFYGNSLMVFSIIWNLHNKLPFTLAIQAFIVISHFQIQRVLCPTKGNLLAFVTVVIGMLVQHLCGSLAKDLISYLT